MAPLGAARVQFAGKPSQAHHTASKVIAYSDLRIDGEPLTVEWDQDQTKFDAIIADARRRANDNLRSAIDAARRREREELRRAQARVNDRARRQRHIYLRHNGAFTSDDLYALLSLKVEVGLGFFALFFDSEQDLQAAYRRVQAAWCNGVSLARVSKIRDPIDRPASAPALANHLPAPAQSGGGLPVPAGPEAAPPQTIATMIAELRQLLKQDIVNKIVRPAIFNAINRPKHEPMSTTIAIKRKPENLRDLRLHFQRKRPKLEDFTPERSTSPSSVEDAPRRIKAIEDEDEEDEEDEEPREEAGLNADDAMDGMAEIEEELSSEPYGTLRAPLPEPVVKQQREEYLYLSSFEHLMLDEQDFAAARKLLAANPPALATPQVFAAWAAAYREMQHLHREATTSVEGIDGALLTPQWSTAPGKKSWRTRGYEPIDSAKKALFLPHRRRENNPHQLKETTTTSSSAVAPQPPAPSLGDRKARLTSRRQARDLNTFETDSLSFNQLLRQSKKVKFAQSAIHNWGLYASESIAQNEMVIEYVGEVIRNPLADVRERYYCLNGIGSSYLFRVDGGMVIDATKRGNIARLINHSCTPSCIARVIKVAGEKRICIYAARPVEAGEELTYDYRFEREDDEDRVPCLCGTVNCRGYLN